MSGFSDDLWPKGRRGTRASDNLDLVLSSATYLPLSLWRRNFLFFGAGDEKLLLMTGGEFPATLERGKTRPVFCLAAIPGGVGFKACPCSTRPRFGGRHRFIPEGCTLLHTRWRTDKTSFLVERYAFPVPKSLSSTLTFKGEVPPECLKTGS